MCNNPLYLRPKEPNPYHYFLGYGSAPSFPVPCGKCFDCLKHRQNDIMVRCYREGCTNRMFFLTFTYAPDFEPLSKSLWSINTDTGEENLVFPAELLNSDDYLFLAAKEDFKNILKYPFGVPRIYRKPIEVPFADDLDYEVRVTPTINVRDVRLAIKNFRIRYKRAKGKLPNFKYALCSEYGSKRSLRPHYHMLVFTNELDYNDMLELLSCWKFGRTQVKSVPRFNPDKSNAPYLVSKYLGKYVSKGVLDISTSREGMTLKARFCSSCGLGCNLSQQMVDYFLCKDMFNYSIDDVDLTDGQLKILLPEIAKRLKISIDGYNYAVPLSIKKRIFGYVNPTSCRRGCWSKIYYLEADYLRDLFSTKADVQCFEFVFNSNAKSLSEALLEFYDSQEASRKLAERSIKTSLINHYRKSKI